jgi:hypothetical protein
MGIFLLSLEKEEKKGVLISVGGTGRYKLNFSRSGVLVRKRSVRNAGSAGRDRRHYEQHRALHHKRSYPAVRF